jgi:hypothetical protein
LTQISPITAGAAAFAPRKPSFFAKLTLCAALLTATLAAQAQCDARLQCCATPAPDGDPSCSAETPAELPAQGPRLGADNPLDIASGNKHQREESNETLRIACRFGV